MSDYNGLAGNNFYSQVSAMCLTGSTYICNPPPENADIDMLFLTNNDAHGVMLDLVHKDIGWEADLGEQYDHCPFYSLRKTLDGRVFNFLLTDNKRYFNQFVRATNIARKLNITDKALRIELFDAICKYNVPVEDIFVPHSIEEET